MTGTVVIAGGGPVGLMLAAELRLGGVPVVLIEPRTDTVEHSRGMAMHGRTLEVLEQRGLAEEIRAEGLFAWPRTPFALLWLDLTSVGEEDYTFGMPQWRAERVLARRAAAAGADIRRGHRVIGCTEHAGGVLITVSGPDGEYQLPACYLVGCDGADSTVRNLVGIGMADHASSDYYGVLGDVEVAEGEEFDAGLHEHGVFGAIPIGPNLLRFMTVEFNRPSVAADTPVDESELSASIERITGRAPKFREVTYLARFGQQSSVADSYRAGRVLLAGDAAHTFFVSGTQGLNGGIQDAINLGWKLAATVRGDAPADLLDTYEQERRPSAQRAMMHAQAQMALMHPMSKVQPLRELVAELFQFEEVNRLLLRMPTEARYPAPAATDHPLQGTRIGGVTLRTADTQTTVAEALREGKGLLLRFTEDDVAIEGWRNRIDVVTAKPVAEIDASLVLVRPDGHIAYAGSNPPTLLASVRTWFGEGRE